MSMPDIFPYHRTWKIICPNLGLASLAGNLDARHKVKIAELVIKRENVKKAVEKALRKTNPELVGLSAMTFQYDTALRVARHIKTISPKTKIALGGYHATVALEEIAESEDAQYIDFLFRGESDLSFNEMVNALEDQEDLSSIQGISFKKNGVFIHNPRRELENLENLKLPDRKQRIWRGYHFLGRPLDSIESSRGCTMRCKFCSIRHMYGHSFRIYSISRVMRDIENAKKSGAKSLFFVDDNITLDMKRFEELLDNIIALGHNDLTYIIQAHSAGIASSEKIVQKMSEAGFMYVFLGIENFSKKNLALLKKGDIAEKSVKAIKMLRKNKICVIGGIIIGNPDDDLEAIEENYAFATSLEVSIYDQILVPYIGTELRDELLAQNLVTNKNNYKLYSGQFANVRTKHLSDRQLDFMKYKMVQKYFTPWLESFKRIYHTNPKRSIYCIFKSFPHMIKDMTLKKTRSLFMTEEERFQQCYDETIKENEFNI